MLGVGKPLRQLQASAPLPDLDGLLPNQDLRKTLSDFLALVVMVTANEYSLLDRLTLTHSTGRGRLRGRIPFHLLQFLAQRGQSLPRFSGEEPFLVLFGQCERAGMHYFPSPGVGTPKRYFGKEPIFPPVELGFFRD